MRRFEKISSTKLGASPDRLKKALSSGFTPDSLLFLARGLLDHAVHLLEEGDAHGAYEVLERELSAVYDIAQRLRCLHRLRIVARTHRISRHCREEPCTSYAFAKSGGGYAVALDFLYGGLAPLGTSKPALMLFNEFTSSNFALSMRLLKTLMRAYIEDIRSRCGKPRILALGSGHLRELEGDPLDLDCVEFTAVEPDAAVCALLRRKYRKRLAVVHAPLGKVENLAADLGRFDLIYTPLLTSTMSDGQARIHLAALKQQLNRGGRLVVGNIATMANVRGYLALHAPRGLHFRSHPELRALINEEKCDVFGDPFSNINYLIVNEGFETAR